MMNTTGNHGCSPKGASESKNSQTVKTRCDVYYIFLRIISFYIIQYNKSNFRSTLAKVCLLGSAGMESQASAQPVLPNDSAAAKAALQNLCKYGPRGLDDAEVNQIIDKGGVNTMDIASDGVGYSATVRSQQLTLDTAL